MKYWAGGASKYLTDMHPRSIHKTMPLSYLPLLSLNIFTEIQDREAFISLTYAGLAFIYRSEYFLGKRKNFLSVIK